MLTRNLFYRPNTYFPKAYFGRYMTVSKGKRYSLADIIMMMGGLASILNAFALFITGQTLGMLLGLSPIFNLGLLNILLGILGLFGGLILIFLGFYIRSKKYAIIGALMGIAGLCGVAILGLIGALLMKQ